MAGRGDGRAAIGHGRPAMNQLDTSTAFQAENNAPIGFAEFVALVAALMALTALGIDSMLPALPAIGASTHVATENERQFIISSFLIGFGIAQLLHGPLADRYGRKPVLTVALAGYVVANIVAALSASFPLLLIARFAGGVAIAASRVVTVALVRDCFSGRSMARVMSLAFMVFMAAPIFAPVMGSTVLLIGSWRLIFWTIAVISALVLVWFWVRMPETLAPERRIPLSLARLLSGVGETLTDRSSLGYTLATTVLVGALYGFINSVQQIVFDYLKRPDLLIPIFISIAGTMAVTNLANSRIVLRFGMRKISHSALVGLFVIASTHLLWLLSGHETIISFAILQALTMASFALANSNFSAMAMENMGRIAGTASSVQGFVSVTTGTIIGALIGQSFNGTPAPLFAGNVIAALTAFTIVAITERGRLFRAH
ncbi:multidrug effflux MFS transporter [Sphingomonas sp. GlSt437]|uniref:multidrug effflux MFS transporter n=2 Tax=Sphingomonas sp. GlSt437 TaxID=3389970 RepID=UPI003EBF4394